MVSGRMALGDAKSERDVDPTFRPDSRLAFRRPGRQTNGAHRTQGIIFADGVVLGVYNISTECVAITHFHLFSHLYNG